MEQKDKLLERICRGDEQAYQNLFKMYYEDLVTFACSLLKNIENAEDIVQEFFVNFYCKKKYKNVNSAIDSYLFRSVKNACLNHIRNEKYRIRKLEQMGQNYVTEIEYQEKNDDIEEKEAVYKAIAELPEQCRRIFMMCCIHGKKYREVADILNISINTVRTQMGRAFKALRKKLVTGK